MIRWCTRSMKGESLRRLYAMFIPVSDLHAERVHSGVLEELLPAGYAAAVDEQLVARQLSDLLDLPPFYGASSLWTHSSLIATEVL